MKTQFCSHSCFCFFWFRTENLTSAFPFFFIAHIVIHTLTDKQIKSCNGSLVHVPVVVEGVESEKVGAEQNEHSKTSHEGLRAVVVWKVLCAKRKRCVEKAGS